MGKLVFTNPFGPGRVDREQPPEAGQNAPPEPPPPPPENKPDPPKEDPMSHFNGPDPGIAGGTARI